MLDERGIPQGMAVFAAAMIGPMQVAGRLAMMAVERHISNRGISIACFAAVALATVSLMSASLVPMMLVAFVILQGSGHGVTSIMKPLVIGDILGRANFGAVSGSQALIFKLSLAVAPRSEEHTSELQSLMRNSYAVFCLKKKKKKYS